MKKTGKKQPEERFFLVGKDEGKVYYPSFSMRLMSGMVDMLLCTVVMMFVARYFPWPVPEGAVRMAERMQAGKIETPEELRAEFLHFLIYGGGLLNYAMQILFVFILVGICILPFWLRYAASPGKLLFGMRIVDAETGEKPSLFQCLLRFSGYLLSFIPPWLGFLWMIFNKKHRGWHDLIGGTAVVYKKKPRFFF